jgi:hypothetical protein
MTEKQGGTAKKKGIFFRFYRQKVKKGEKSSKKFIFFHFAT